MAVETYKMSICVDCMAHLANGECGSCHEESGHDREPLSAVPAENNVSLGMFAEDHAPDCNGEDCDCENLGFSMSSCDGCGSTLGGDRYAATGWIGERAKV